MTDMLSLIIMLLILLIILDILIMTELNNKYYYIKTRLDNIENKLDYIRKK